MKLGSLLRHLGELETGLAGGLRSAAERHRDDHDVYHQCQTFAVTADRRAEAVEPHAERYGGGGAEWRSAVGAGSDDLLEDLRTLHLRAQEVAITWTIVSQAAKAARDEELLALANDHLAKVDSQARWLTTRIKTGAPQAMVVA